MKVKLLHYREKTSWLFLRISMKPEHYFGPKFRELLSGHDLSKPYLWASNGGAQPLWLSLGLVVTPLTIEMGFF